MGKREYHNNEGDPSTEETVKGSHNYVIESYSQTKRIGIGKYMSSDVFRVGGYDWAIYFYPNGREPEDNGGYVSAFVALASKGTNVHALLDLSVLDQSGKGKTKLPNHIFACVFNYKGTMRGHERFFKKTSLEGEGSHYIKDDCLIINCTIGGVTRLEEGPKHYTIPLPASDMSLNFKERLDSGTAADITFEVGDATFRAHKLILAAGSPVFKSQFSALIGNPNTDKLIIEDVEPVIFEAMLVFMYSDHLPDLQEMASSVPECTSATLLQHLLAAADCFGMDRLKLLCEAKLCDAVTTERVAITAAFPDQHPCPHLKTGCQEFAALPRNLGGGLYKGKTKFTEVHILTINKEVKTFLANLKLFTVFGQFRSFVKRLVYGDKMTKRRPLMSFDLTENDEYILNEGVDWQKFKARTIYARPSECFREG